MLQPTCKAMPTSGWLQPLVTHLWAACLAWRGPLAEISTILGYALGFEHLQPSIMSDFPRCLGLPFLSSPKPKSSAQHLSRPSQPVLPCLTRSIVRSLESLHYLGVSFFWGPPQNVFFCWFPFKPARSRGPEPEANENFGERLQAKPGVIMLAVASGCCARCSRRNIVTIKTDSGK